MNSVFIVVHTFYLLFPLVFTCERRRQVDLRVKRLGESDLKHVKGIDSSFDVEQCLDYTKKSFGDKYVFEMSLAEHPSPFRKRFSHYDEDYMRMLSSFVKEGGSFEIEENGKCVAVAVTQCHKWNRSLQIWEFLVDRDYRGRGLGRLLMQTVFDYAKDMGMRSVFVETQTSNVKAVRYYEHMGFEIAGFDDGFYSNSDVENREVALFMRRSI